METGLRCRLGREIGTSSFVGFPGQPTIVRYWEMFPSGRTRPRPMVEEEGGWLALAETRDALSCDRQLLDQCKRRS